MICFLSFFFFCRVHRVDTGMPHCIAFAFCVLVGWQARSHPGQCCIVGVESMHTNRE